MITRKLKLFIGAFLIAAIAVLVVQIKHRPKYELSVLAIFRNEARFLPEWIAYHQMQGVDHFYLLNNLSKDDYKAALQPFIDKGVVELYEWPYHGKNQKEWNKIQCGAYTHLLKEKKYETRWMAIIDTDEFLAVSDNQNLKEFLKPYEPYGGVAINWQLFGTSDVEMIPAGKTIIGSLTHRAPKEHPANLFLKSIVQPKKVKKITQPHYCSYNKPYYHVSEKFEKLPSKSLSRAVSIDKVRIHHYTYRDNYFFKSEKQKRFREWHPETPPPEANPAYNEVEDNSLTAFAEPVESALKN